MPSGPIQYLDLQGRGGAGGIATGPNGRGPGLVSANLTPAIAAAITQKMAKNGFVVIHGCSEAVEPDAAKMQTLATLLKRPVIACDNEVTAPYATNGTWYVYYP